MKTILKWAVVLGLAVEAWTFVMGFSGWYRHPTWNALFFLVIPMQVAILLLALRETAREGRGYGAQVGAGTTISALAAVIIMGGSLLFTEVVFPRYFEELREMHRVLLAGEGLAPAAIEAKVAEASKGMTSWNSALQGGVGTVGTGLVVSLLAAIGLRRKPDAQG